MDVVSKHLRKLFKRVWNEKFPQRNWESNEASGNSLVQLLPDSITITVEDDCIEKLKAGDEENWDTSTLVFVLLQPVLNLFDECTHKDEIETIRSLTEKYIDCPSEMSCQSSDFVEDMKSLKSVAMNLFDKGVELEIGEIEKPSVERRMKSKMQQLLDNAKDLSQQCKILASDLEGSQCTSIVHHFTDVDNFGVFLIFIFIVSAIHKCSLIGLIFK